MNATVAALEKTIVCESTRLQTLRGLACLLLVSFHVIGLDGKTGIAVPADSLYREFCNLFIHLRMPLFCFLSGFVYAYKPIQPGMSGLFMRKKVLRLLIPLVVVGTAFFVLQQIAPSNRHTPWSQMWTVYVLPYGHFWFLQAIIVLFAALAVLERYRLLSRKRTFLMAFAAVVGLHFWVNAPEIFSVHRALYLAPFFLIGIAANRWQDVFNHPDMRLVVSAVFAAMMTYHVWACLHGVVAARGTYFGTALSLSSILAVMYWMPSVRGLAWIGTYSFSIYLYHVFFSAGMRIVLKQMHITNIEAHFVLGLVLALAGPILFEQVVKRWNWARVMLLGQPAEKRRVETPRPLPTPLSTALRG